MYTDHIELYIATLVKLDIIDILFQCLKAIRIRMGQNK